MRPAVRQSFPLLSTSLVNKCGTIGVGLIPVLLVERGLSTAESSIAMSIIRGSLLFGTLVGGIAADRFGARWALLASFVASALGLGLLPWPHAFWAICVCGVLAQLGHSMYQSSSRLLLVGLVEDRYRKEAMGWMRMVNNLGQALAFGLGSLGAGLGLVALMSFDSLTSWAAVIVGAKLLPAIPSVAIEQGGDAAAGAGLDKATRENEENEATEAASNPLAVSWRPFVICTGLIAVYSFTYELFTTGAAAKARIVHGPDGLRIFAQSMLINTVLCTLLAVPASRWFSRPSWSFPVGLALTGIGAAVTFVHIENTAWIYFGAFLVTLGEIIFTALAQFTLIRLTPASKRSGAVYSLGLMCQGIGRVTGAAVAFPLIVHGEHAAGFCAVATLASVMLCVGLGRNLGEAPAS